MGVWALQKEKQAKKAELAAIEKEKEAEKAAADLKNRLHQLEADQTASRRQRDQELAVEMEARHAAEDTKAVLEFLQNHLLTAGRPGGGSLEAAFWAEGHGKDVTLRRSGRRRGPGCGVICRPAAGRSDGSRTAGFRLFATEPGGACGQAIRAGLCVAGGCRGNRPSRHGRLPQPTRGCIPACRPHRGGSRVVRSEPSAVTLAVRGALLLLQHKPAEAELKLRECLAIRQRTVPDDWTTSLTKSLLGQALLAQKKLADAEPLLLAAYDGLKKRKDAIPPQERSRIIEACQRLVKLYEAWGKDDLAAKWRKELEVGSAASKP